MKAVEIKNLTVKFGGFTAVDNLSFEVEKGEIFGFLGANGAGKTTAIRVMCGLLLPTSGTVRIAGIDGSDTDSIKKSVGYMSQKFTLYDDLTVRENLFFKASIRKIPDEIAGERIERAFEFINFSFSPGILVRELPSGVKQQVSLAATLLHEPEILFLDEPTSGVSPATRARFWTLIRSLSKEGRTVFVTTHYMDEAEQCGSIALMRSGRLIALGSKDQLAGRAYPEGLAEFSSRLNGKFDPGRLMSDARVRKIWPFGLKYHAELGAGIKTAELAGSLPEGAAARNINPSLEDVFMKMVEGDDR